MKFSLQKHLLIPSRVPQVEFGQSLQSADEVHAGSDGGSQLISTSILFFNDISEPKWSVPTSLHTSIMRKGGSSGGIKLRELQSASFSWITNVNVSGLMLVTR